MKNLIRKMLLTAIAVVVVTTSTKTIITHAATPSLNISVPKIPNISTSVKVELPDNVLNNWFKEHPLNIDFSKINFNFSFKR